jgi:hypothetical protein
MSARETEEEADRKAKQVAPVNTNRQSPRFMWLTFGQPLRQRVFFTKGPA